MAQELSIRMTADGALMVTAAKQVDAALDGITKSANSAAVGLKSLGDSAAASFGKTELSAKQTAAAMRGLPAQFTDIFVSLQAGQSPMTVLFQQGGQLKDMFGGVGNAARAMGSYVASLANPFTVAAAAIGAVAIAYYQGSKEADAFRLALTNTGNAAGISASEMVGLASAMGSSFGQTIGQSADALAAMAATGQVGRTSLQQFAQTAVDMEKTTGQSIEATAKIFADLGKDPVTASAKLNESLNYLSASTYAQIKAAQDLGETEKAAALAQDAYAKAMDGRTANITQNLGYIEKAWFGLKAAARESWDAMLNVGRETAVSDKIAKIRSEIELAKGGLRGASARQVEAMQQELYSLQEIERMNKKAGMSAAERAATEKAGIAAINAVSLANQGALTKQEQMNKALADYRKQLQALPADQKQSAEQIAKVEASIREKFKEKDPSNSGASELAGLMAKTKANDAYLLSLQTLGASAEKQTATELALGKVTEELAGKITGVERANKLRMQSELEKQISQEKAIATEKENIKILEESAKANYETYVAAMKRVDSLSAQVDKERESVAAIGLSKEALADLQAAKYEDAASSKDRLAAYEEEKDASGVLGAAYRQEAKALRELASLKQEGAAKQAAVDAAKKAEDAWKQASQTINQSLTDALLRGFESGKSFAQNLRDTLKNMFGTLILRPVIQAVVGGVTGLGGASASAGGLSSLFGGGGGGAGSLGVMDTVSKVYSTITGGFTALGDKVAFAAQDIGAWLTTNTTGALNTFGSKLMSGSGTLGTIGSYAGGALAGYGLGKAISGQYTTGLGKNTLEVGGTAIGTIFGGPIGAAIGGAVGGAINRAFGMGAKNVTGEGITGTFGASGANVQAYSDWQQKGGWFRSDKSGRDFSAITTELDQFLDGAVTSVATATKSYAGLLGLNSDALNGFSKSITVSLKGLDAAGKEKAIADAISGFGDSMAERLLGTFETVTTTTKKFFSTRTTEIQNWIAGPYVRAGETASQALARLGESLAGVNTIFGTLNKTLLESSLAGADVASKLIDVFGGLQAMTQATNAYYQAFYSESERNTKTTEKLTKALAGMGMKLPETLSGWRALVEAQDLSTDAGRKYYAALINLAPAFAQVTGAADSLAAKLGKVVSQLATDALTQVDKQITASTAAADAARAVANAYREASTSLTAAVANIMGAVGDVRQNATNAYTAALTGARGGDVTAMQALPQLATAMLAQQRNGAGSSLQAALQAAKAASELSGVGSVANALGVQKDYQAKLYDVNTAALEVLRSQLASGNATVDQLKVLGATLTNVGQMLADSDKLTVGAVTTSSGLIKATLVDTSGRVVGTLDNNSALNLNGLNGQTSILSKLSADQILKLQASTGVQTDSLAVQEIATRATAGSSATLTDVLAQLKLPDPSLTTITAQIANGNFAIVNGLSGVVGAINNQTLVQQAEIKRQQDLTKAQKDIEALVNTYKPQIDSMSASLAAKQVEKAGYDQQIAAVAPNYNGWSYGVRWKFDWVWKPGSERLAGEIAQAESALGNMTNTYNGQLEAMRAQIRALGGVPAFATGGMHTGGLRLVGENGPELEVTGPARIFSAQQTQDMLRASSAPLAVQTRGGQQGDPALRQLVAELTNEVANLRIEARASAAASQDHLQLTRRMTRNGQSMPISGVQNDTIKVEVAA